MRLFIHCTEFRRRRRKHGRVGVSVSRREVVLEGKKKKKKSNGRWRLGVDPRSAATKIKAREERKEKTASDIILQLVTVSHPEIHLMIKHLKKHLVLNTSTLFIRDVEVFFPGFRKHLFMLSRCCWFFCYFYCRFCS